MLSFNREVKISSGDFFWGGEFLFEEIVQQVQFLSCRELTERINNHSQDRNWCQSSYLTFSKKAIKGISQKCQTVPDDPKCQNDIYRIAGFTDVD